MKSKKTVALALTAAMAISMASMTAFAKAEYVDNSQKADVTKLYATITISDEELTKLAGLTSDEDKAAYGLTSVSETGKTAEITYAGLKKLNEKNTLESKSNLNTGTKTFEGWSNTSVTTAPSGATLKEAATKTIEDSTVITFANKDNVATAYIPAVYSSTTDDEQIAKNLKAIEDAKKDEEAAKSRDEKLKAKDEANGALDNVKTDDGPKTKAAPVSDPVAIEKAAKTDRNVHDFKVVDKDMGDGALAWVYYVNEGDDAIKLISGKNARVTLKAPKGYDPTNYKVSVYHVKGYCSAEKVKGLDIASTDVTFWGNNFSPYVLVLTPKDAVAGTSTGNPSTGDFSAVPVAMLAAAALGATGFVAYKKRKAE